MYYRVENENLIQAPEKNLKIFIANPIDEQYRFFGYTDQIVETMPELDSEIEYEIYYEQIDDVIYKRYREVSYEEPIEENEVI